MPQRTNAFQELIAWLQRWIHDPDVKISESAMIRNYETNKDIEVDVLVEFTKGERFRCAFECRDHKRKASPKWIDELCAERDHCRLDKIIAVHSRGFTASAITLAGKKGIVTLTVDDLANDVPAPGAAINILRKLATTPQPVIRTVLLITPKHLNPVGLSPNTEIRDAQGGKKTTLERFAQLVLQKCPPPATEAGQQRSVRCELPAGRYFAVIDRHEIECTEIELTVELISGTCSTPQSLSELPSRIVRVIFAKGTVPTGIGTLDTFAAHESQTGKDSIMIAGPPSNKRYDMVGELRVTAVDDCTGEQKQHILRSQAKPRCLAIRVVKVTLNVSDGRRFRRVKSQVSDIVIHEGTRVLLDDLLRVEVPKRLQDDAWFCGSTGKPERRNVTLIIPNLYVECEGRKLLVQSIDASCNLSSRDASGDLGQ